MTRRFWVGLGLTLPVFVLEMGGHVPPLGPSRFVPAHWSIWIQFAWSTPVVLWRRAVSLRSGNLNMFTLIALGAGAAYLYSHVATFAPSLFPAGFRMIDGTVSVYCEAAAVSTVLVLLGQVLEERAREQAGERDGLIPGFHGKEHRDRAEELAAKRRIAVRDIGQDRGLHESAGPIDPSAAHDGLRPVRNRRVDLLQQFDQRAFGR